MITVGVKMETPSLMVTEIGVTASAMVPAMVWAAIVVSISWAGVVMLTVGP